MKEIPIIPHNFPTLDRQEEEAARQVLLSGWLAQGKEVRSFEDEFCEYLGLPEGHAVAISSGTAALYLSLWGLGAEKKKTAYPVYACSALRNAVKLAQAETIYIDVAANSPNIDTDKLNNSDAEFAIIPHMYGIPANLKSIRKNITVIEDCAQALGASMDNLQAGLHGKVGVFSFYATKIITSGGQGGMIVSKDKSLIDSIRDYREFDCRHDDRKRFNFQMTDLQASIGRIQLKKLPNFIQRREKIFQQYKNLGLTLLDSSSPSDSPTRYRSVAICSEPDKLIKHLEKAKIRAIVPICDWELLSQLPRAQALSRSTVSLPTYPTLSEQNLNAIIETLRSYL